MIQYVFPFLAAEISTWLDHPRSATDITQPEELPGTWPAGPMVRIRKTQLFHHKSLKHERVCIKVMCLYSQVFSLIKHKDKPLFEIIRIGFSFFSSVKHLLFHCLIY